MIFLFIKFSVVRKEILLSGFHYFSSGFS